MELSTQQEMNKFQQQLPKQIKQFYLNLFNFNNTEFHKQNRIIINSSSQQLSKLTQNSEFSQQLVEILIRLCQSSVINIYYIIRLKFISQTKIEQPLIIFLIKQLYVQQVSSQYKNKITNLFKFLSNQSLPITYLQTITQQLSNHFHSNKLSLQLIQTSYQLIQLGFRQRQKQEWFGFRNQHQNQGINIFQQPQKWIFNKGMTIFISFQIGFTQNTQYQFQSTLLIIKTDAGNAIHVKLHSNYDIEIQTTILNKQSQSIRILSDEHKLKQKQLIMMGIELQLTQGGFLKSNSFSLNICLNNYKKKSLISSQKVPKFTSSQHITQFSLFNKFVGKVYLILISNKDQLQAFDKLRNVGFFGIPNQQTVKHFLDKELLKKEHLITVLNAKRLNQNIIYNYLNQNQHATYKGFASEPKKLPNYNQIVQILLPYLYFLVVIEKRADQISKPSEIFDLVVKKIININLEQKDYKPNKDILFILYFLQLSHYQISQTTLNHIIDLINNDQSNPYKQTFKKHLNYHLIQSKGLKTLNSIKQQDKQSLQVQKIHLMFYVQTLWKQKWNQLQGWGLWWSPKQFIFQKNHPFNPQDYTYDQQKANILQWEVINFVTNDLVKPILAPIFKVPQYARLNTYQKEYIGKQYMTINFQLELGYINKGKKIALNKYLESKIDKLKRKILGNAKQIIAETQITQLQHSPTIQKVSVKSSFESQCVYIDLLSVIVSQIKMSTSGFIRISSCHNSKSYDHMCVKAFKNEYLLYKSIHLSQVLYLRKRRFNQSTSTLQIRLKSGALIMIYFPYKNLQQFLQKVSQQILIKKNPYQMYLDAKQPFSWIQKKMTNYQYLQWLNDVAGRSFIDITQYPVLPWVYVQHNQQELAHDKIYRDLFKNMGSHGGEDRIKHFIEKYNSNNQQELFNQYHFGTHYSSSAIIFNYLIRVRPFSIGSLTLQGGKFDCADRTFYSYVGSWANATNSPTDIRQLIPEVYTLPEMFLNINNYDFGLTQDKARIDNVQLPQWSGENPYKFISKLRKKLQSPYACQNINHWIDLTFGYKQRGQQAISNMNIFFPLTYQDAINLDTVQDLNQKVSFETQIAHFGQNPSQIIGNNPHPIRMANKNAWQGRLIADGGKGINVQKCWVDKKSQKHQATYSTIHQPNNVVLAVKFIDQFNFIVVRKHQYCLFKILTKKNDFISKEQDISYEFQTPQVSINHKYFAQNLPLTSIGSSLAVVGGYYNSYLNFLFIDEPKYNQTLRFDGLSTITALAYTSAYNYLYLGGSQGQIKIYEVNFSGITQKVSNSTKSIQFLQINSLQIHDAKINEISINQKANLFTTCSSDGYLKILNLYSHQLMRVLRNPQSSITHETSISHSIISCCPLYCSIFYSSQSNTIYSYSINGQFLSKFLIKSENKQNNSNIKLINMMIMNDSQGMQCLVGLMESREIFVWELPFLQVKRRIQLKKDIQYQLTAFQANTNGKVCLVANNIGSLQILSDTASY